jgi:hypothetical protein
MLAAAALGACGGAEAGHASAPTIARWTLQRVATIDPDSAGVNAAIRSVVADDDGNVYVAGYGAGGIYVFDSTGRSVRVLGRAGSGPGEFKNRYSLAWAGDTLAVYDPENGRVELVDRMGNWVASEPSLRITGGSDVRLFQSGRKGFFRPSYQKVAGSDGIRSTLIRSGLGVAPDTLILPEDNVGQPFTLICRSDRASASSQAGMLRSPELRCLPTAT